MKFTRNEIKVSFPYDPTFTCNDATVECIVDAHLLVPECVNEIIKFNFPNEDMFHVRGRGVAKCLPDDVYDENTGKRIARLKAEQAVLVKVEKILNRIANSMFKPTVAIEKFEKKVGNCIEHNINYYMELSGKRMCND